MLASRPGLGLRCLKLRANEDAVAFGLDLPAVERVERGRLERLAGAQVETGMARAGGANGGRLVRLAGARVETGRVPGAAGGALVVEALGGGAAIMSAARAA